jgi:hypothetical protein
MHGLTGISDLLTEIKEIWKKQLQHFRKAVAIEPSSALYHRCLGEIYPVPGKSKRSYYGIP